MKPRLFIRVCGFTVNVNGLWDSELCAVEIARVPYIGKALHSRVVVLPQGQVPVEEQQVAPAYVRKANVGIITTKWVAAIARHVCTRSPDFSTGDSVASRRYNLNTV